MPFLTSETIENVPVNGNKPISQAVVKIVNNGFPSSICYVTGYSNDSSPQVLIAEALINAGPGEVYSFSYNIVADLFQFDFVFSQDHLMVRLFLITSAGVWIPVELASVRVNRITSEFRDNLEVDNTSFAALSFRRKTSFSNPRGSSASIRAEGIDILSKQPIRFLLMAGGTLDGTFVDYPTPGTPIPSAETALQVNYTCTTLTGGRVLTQGTGSGISGAYQNVSVNLLAEQVNHNLLGTEPVTLLVSSLVGSDHLAVTLRMSEDW